MKTKVSPPFQSSALIRKATNIFTCRYQLPIVFIIMNNNGIYRGLDSETWKAVTENADLPLK